MHCPSWSALKRRRIYYHISAKWLEQFHFQEVRISISRLNFKIQNRKVVSWEIAPLKCKCNVVPKNFNHGSAREWQATLHVSQQQKNVCRNAAIKIRIVQDFSTWHKQIKLHFSYFKKPQRYAIRAGTVGSLNPALQSTLKSLFLFILSDFHWIYRWETRIWELAKIASQNKYWWCKRLTKSCCLYICDYMILFIGSYGYLYSSLFRFSLTLTVSFVYFTTVPFIFLYLLPSEASLSIKFLSFFAFHQNRSINNVWMLKWIPRCIHQSEKDAYIDVRQSR